MGITRVTTNLVPSKVIKYQTRLVTHAENVTLESLRINSLDKARIIRQYSDKISLRPDRTDFTSYSYFGSLVELVRVSINHVIESWPGSLHVNPVVPDIGRLATVLNLTYNSADNTSTFQVPIVVANNNFKFNLITGTQTYPDHDLRNLPQEFTRYSLGYNNTELPIVGFTGQTTSTSQFITLKVLGNAFPDALTPIAVARDYHIQPNGHELGLYLRGITDLSRYLLNIGEERFSALFRLPSINEGEYDEQYLTWPCSDGYNPDFTGSLFTDYQDTLFGVAQVYDAHKTNLLVRRLVPASLLDQDQTYAAKMSQLLQGYAREFDKVKAFIDGLAYLNTVTYDRMNNAPDALVMNLARTLGWDTFPIASNETGVVDALFSASVKHGKTNLSPAEVDTELWRRVVMNSTWLLQAKGTRQALEAVLGLVGAPEALVEFNEYIYLADRRLRITSENITFNFNTTLVNNTGIATPNSTPTRDTEFSVLGETTPVSDLNNSGAYVSKDVSGLAIIQPPVQPLPDRSLIPQEPTGLDYPQAPLFIPFQNQGFGQDYMQAVSDQGFNLKRVVDNKKSWNGLTGGTRDHVLSQTHYEQEDSRLVVNSKEISINLNPAKAVEYDVYSYIKTNGFPLGKLYNAPYPQTHVQKDIDFTENTFFDFVSKVYSRFINVRTRKTSKSYPTLHRIYLDYLRNTANVPASSALTIARIISFTRKIGTSWNQLMEQVLPATAILTESGLHLRNTVFDTQKFAYKSGIDAGSEFRTLIPPIINTDIVIADLDGSVDTGVTDTLYVTELTSSAYAGNNNNINTDSFSAYTTKVPITAGTNMQVYSFTPPIVTTTGLGKITVGTTGTTAIHYYANTVEKDFTINLSSDYSDKLRGPLGATVGILFYPYSTDYEQFSNTPIARIIFDRATTTGTTAGTSITLFGAIPNSLLSANIEYLAKVFFIKTELITGHQLPAIPVAPLSYSENYTYNLYPQEYRYHPKFYNRSIQVPVNTVTFSTEPVIRITGLGLPYGTYDANSDYYFASVGQPNKAVPVVTTKSLTPYDEYFSGSSSTQVTTFCLSNRTVIPTGVYLNGASLAINIDYVYTPGYVGSAVGNHFTLTNALLPTDVIRASYMTFQEAIQPVAFNIAFASSGLTSGSVNTTGANPWFNNDTQQLEVTLPSLPQADTISILYGTTYISGASLNTTTGPTTYGFTAPTPRPDSITAYYFLNDPTVVNAHPLLTQPTIVDFQAPLGSTASGNFYVEFAAENDLVFNTILASLAVPYVNLQSYFRGTVDLNQFPGITANTKYLMRISAVNDFLALTGEHVFTERYGDIYKVRLGNLTTNTYTGGSSSSSNGGVGFNNPTTTPTTTPTGDPGANNPTPTTPSPINTGGNNPLPAPQ